MCYGEYPQERINFNDDYDYEDEDDCVSRDVHDGFSGLVVCLWLTLLIPFTRKLVEDGR